MGGLTIAMATSITPAQYRITLGFAGFMTVFGAALLMFGGVFLRDAWASRDWPTATGTVEAVNVVRDRSANSNTSRPYYYYAVTYEYEVAGQSYTGDRYSLGGGSTASQNYESRREARNAGEEAYPEGSEVAVYYDPENPGSTVLKLGANFGNYVPLVMGLLFTPSGIWFLMLMLRVKPVQG
jgi:hypothetical protein